MRWTREKGELRDPIKMPGCFRCTAGFIAGGLFAHTFDGYHEKFGDDAGDVFGARRHVAI